MKNKPWHKEALELTFKGWSGRKIAKHLGMSKSTINDYLKKYKENPEKLHEVVTKENAPKVLSMDIETSKIKAYVWGLWKQDISIDNILEDWYVICWSAKWLGQDEVLNSSVHHWEMPPSGRFKDNERLVVEAMWKLLDEADAIVAHNGAKFDKKKLNAKFLEYGMPEPSPYKVIDTLLIAKANFAMTSNKLDYITKLLEGEGKHSTGDKLWRDCMADDIDSLDRMQDYCDNDVVELEHIYLKLCHWDKNHPNLALHYDDNKVRCNSCGSDDLEKLENKTANTNLSKFSVYRCNCCSKILRDRENTLSKEKRQSLLMNVR